VSRSGKWTTTEGCKRCQANPRSVCVACTQRRRRATQLHERDGLSVGQIAQTMGLTGPQVERLLEEEAQLRDLQQFICDSVPVEVVQALIKQRQEEAPALTEDEIAQAAGYVSRTGLRRAVGLEPTGKYVRRGKEYPSRLHTHIDVGSAGRIVQALGFAPHEIPGL